MKINGSELSRISQENNTSFSCLLDSIAAAILNWDAQDKLN